MKKLLFISLLFLVGFGGMGQNLVTNPSFEDTISCPITLGQTDRVVSWYSPTVATPDYFHSCSIGGVDVPVNGFGVQTAKTGNAYVGFHSRIIDEYREYITASLSVALQAGKNYYVETFVSLAESSELAIDGLGIYFSIGPIDTSGVGNGKLIPNIFPQIDNPTGNILSDTTNWIKFSGTFVAGGGENYITIGNFKSDAMTQILNMGGTWLNASYYYIDDVLVLEETLGRKETIDNYQITIYPNSTTGKFTVQGATGEIQVYDLFGRLLLRSNKPEIDMSNYPAGIYVVKAGEATLKLILK